MMTRCAGRFTPAASVEVATRTLSMHFDDERDTQSVGAARGTPDEQKKTRRPRLASRCINLTRS